MYVCMYVALTGKRDRLTAASQQDRTGQDVCMYVCICLSVCLLCVHGAREASIVEVSLSLCSSSRDPKHSL